MNTNTSNQHTLSLNDFIILALAHKPFLYEDIDRLYQERKWVYAKAFQTSPHKNSPALRNHTTLKQVYIQKVGGIVAYLATEVVPDSQTANKEAEPLFFLIKKGYKFVWNYVKNKRHLSLDKFSNDYIKKVGEDNVIELDLIFHEIVLLFLGHLFQKPIDTKGIMYPLLQQFIRKSVEIQGDSMDDYFKKEFDKNREDIDAIRIRYHIGNRRNRTYKLETLFEQIIMKETEEITGGNPFLTMEGRSLSFKKGRYSRYIGAISGFLKKMQLDESELVSLCELTSYDIDKVCYSWLCAKRENNISDEEEPSFLTFLFFFKALLDECQKTRSYFLDNHAEETLLEWMSFKEQLDSQQASLANQTNELVSLQNHWQEERKRYDEKIAALQKENEQLSKRLTEQNENQKELLALRQYAFYTNQTNDYSHETETEDLPLCLDFLQNKRIVLLGGHVKWQQKMKEQLPNITSIHPSQKNTDLTFLNRESTHLFVNTATNSHAFMKRVLAHISKQDTHLYYINANGNIEQCLRYMYLCLKESDKNN